MIHDVGIQEYEPPPWVRDELHCATGHGVRVAVLDSGWDRGQHDSRVLEGVSFADSERYLVHSHAADDHDRVGHGTACASLILQVASEAAVVPVRIFGQTLETSPAALLAAIHWAVEAKVQIVNMSLGTTLREALWPLYVSCERARRAGIIMVAAGRSAGTRSYPASFANVIGVSAARFDSPYDYRYRPGHAFECEAWGLERPVRLLRGERRLTTGASLAAANMSGIVAIILERYPGATLEQLRGLLKSFAMPRQAPRTQTG